MKETKKLSYDYLTEINKDMNNKNELRNLLEKWKESEPSDLRTRLIKEIQDEINDGKEN